MTTLEKHLQEITPKALREFREDTELFMTFASSSGKNGLVQLGVNGKGNYITKHRRNKIVEHANSLQAVQEYTKLLS